MKGSVLVLGAGVAGMRAASELMQQGFKVYLIEKDSRIGGKMLMPMCFLSPTNECAACAIQPLMLDILNNPNATIFTSSELLSLQGELGNFSVEVLQEKAEGIESSQKVKLEAGAVIVATGLEADKSKLSERLGLELDDEGYLKREPDSSHPLLTTRKGVFVCGEVQAHKGIGNSVIQACAAASYAASLLVDARGSEVAAPVKNEPIPVNAADEPKIAVIIDQGSPDVKDLLDLDELCAYTQSLPGVESVDVTPSAIDGSKIKEVIGKGDFNRLIVAGPSPIPHEPQFQQHAEAAGLNPYLLEIVNLHNQCAKVHSKDKMEATEKAKILMKMGVARVRQLEPLEELRVAITQRCLVIGGSPSGISCAARLAELGIEAHLVEEASNLVDIRGNDHPLLKPLVARLSNDDKVEVHTATTLKDVEGCLGNFKVNLIEKGESVALEVGAIVVASRTNIAESVDSASIEESLALEKNPNGFYLSTQGILNLLDFTTSGVFNCGPARAELEIEGEVIDGEAAASRAACVLTSPTLARVPVVSSVVDEKCDGCAYCIDPCPTRSLTLLEYKIKGEVKKIAEANEVTCIGCGICMSTCPKEGILVKHFKPEYFSEMVKTALENTEPQPVIVSFCCNRCAYPGADEAGMMGMQYHSGVRIIRTVCSGMIHPNIIINALTQDGADGVLLCGCHPGNCRSHNGIDKAQARAEAIELMLEDFALEPERFRLELISASEGAKFAKVIEEMKEELSALGPNPYRQ
ncbi:hydrogenase iron-sulfur subunit [Acidobacteriota bacterium]